MQKNTQNLSKIVKSDHQNICFSFPSYQYAEEFVMFLKYLKTINPMLNEIKVELIKQQKKNNSSLDLANKTKLTKLINIKISINNDDYSEVNNG